MRTPRPVPPIGPPPLSFHKPGVACLARRRGCLSGGGGGVTSALLRPGAGGLLALAGGVDTRYSRGGGSNSMTSPGMKAPPHTLARLETHAGSPPVTSLFFTVSRFTPQVSSKPPCLPQNCRSNALFICSRLTWTVSAPRRGSLMSPITSPRRRVAPVSTCLLSIR